MTRTVETRTAGAVGGDGDALQEQKEHAHMLEDEDARSGATTTWKTARCRRAELRLTADVRVGELQGRDEDGAAQGAGLQAERPSVAR